MKKHIAILACLLAVFLPAVPVWGQEDSYEKCNLVSGVTKDMYTVMKEFMTEDQANIISKYQLDKIDEALLKLKKIGSKTIKQFKKNIAIGLIRMKQFMIISIKMNWNCSLEL